jgi:hypothetical protein
MASELQFNASALKTDSEKRMNSITAVGPLVQVLYGLTMYLLVTSYFE